MKKLLIILTIFIISLTLISCEAEEPVPDPTPQIKDTVKPLLNINPSSAKIFIIEGTTEDIDALLLEGVDAFDNIDGDITSEITVDKSELNINEPGVYTVLFYVLDSSGNSSDIKTKTVTVTKRNYILQEYEIFSNKITGEKSVDPQKLFGGAYYYKVVSSFDKWVGIEGIITLPEIDINRYSGNANTNLPFDPNFKGLDTPSIYMGGKAHSESDVGLTFNRGYIYDSNGNFTITTGGVAFRPFWRYITTVDKDLGGYDPANGRRYQVAPTNPANPNNLYGNWMPNDTEFYYLPGDKIRMIVHSPKENFLQLQIQIIEKSTIPFYVNMRAEYNWKDPEDFFSPIIRSGGHGGSADSEFKRVNAIDQSNNEGGTVIPTNSKVNIAIWESVYLHRKINGVMYRVPFNEDRSNSLGAPNSNYYTVSSINKNTGGTSIIINPSNA